MGGFLGNQDSPPFKSSLQISNTGCHLLHSRLLSGVVFSILRRFPQGHRSGDALKFGTRRPMPGVLSQQNSLSLPRNIAQIQRVSSGKHPSRCRSHSFGYWSLWRFQKDVLCSKTRARGLCLDFADLAHSASVSRGVVWMSQHP